MESGIKLLTTRIPRPSFLALLALISGIVAAHSLSITNSLPFIVAIFVSFLCGLIIRHTQTRLLLFLFLFFFLGGAQQSHWNSRQQSAINVRDHIITSNFPLVQVSGKLHKPSRSPKEGKSFWLKAGSTISAGGTSHSSSVPILVYCYQLDDPIRWEYGDDIEFVGKITPLSINKSPRDFDRYFAAQGAVLVAEIEHLTAYQKKPSITDHFLNAFGKIGDRIEEDIEKNISSRDSGFVMAATLGRTGSLDPTVYEEARRSGIAHIFAVSGLHTGIIGIFLIGITRLFGLRPNWSFIFVFLGLFSFIAIIGFRPSAIRAAALVLVYSGQYIFHRQVDGLASLSSVALFFLLFDSSLLFRMDFQFSFLCAAVIFLIMPSFSKWQEELLLQWREKHGWSKIPTFLSKLIMILICSCFIQLALAPLMISLMGIASLVSPISNLVALTSIPFLVAFTFIASILNMISTPLASIPFGIAELISTLILWWSHLTSSFPFAAFENSFIWPAWLVAVYYLILSAGSWIRLRPQFSVSQQSLASSLQLLTPLLFIFVAIFLSSLWPKHQITFLDIGQGDAILIEDHHTRILVDTGPPSGSKLLKELHAVGVSELDLLILTHADADHIGGVEELLSNFPVKEIWINNEETLQMISPFLIQEQIPVSIVEMGTELVLSDISRIKILHPAAGFIPTDPRNDASIALIYSYGEIDLLLTGDLEEDGESALLQSSIADLSGIEIFKAGHHGSVSSSTEKLMSTVQPEVMIISCGLHNRYSHPAQEVLDRAKSNEAAVFRTDWMGRVRINLEPTRYRISPERPIGIIAPKIFP